jgi:Ca-activated chloride channel family protein
VIEKPCKILFSIFLAALFSAWIDPYRDEVSRGNGEFHNKNYEQAKKHYDSAEKYIPNDGEKGSLAFNKGNADYMAGNYDSAIANFKKALQSDDREVQKKAFFNLGNTYMKMENNREAVNSFINALKIDPGYEKAKKNIEYLLSDKKDQKGDDKNDKDKKGQDGKDKKDKNDKDKDKDKDSKRDNKDAGEGSEGKMNQEQIRNLLESMKNRPVRRKKGEGGERFYLEKNW